MFSRDQHKIPGPFFKVPLHVRKQENELKKPLLKLQICSLYSEEQLLLRITDGSKIWLKQ